jgi:hypothetical protein
LFGINRRQLELVIAVGVALVGAALIVGVTRSGRPVVFLGDMTDQKVIIEDEKVEVVSAWLEMDSGQMTIRSGSDAAIEVDLRTNYTEDRPQADYSVNYGVGLLRVTQPVSTEPILLGARRTNEWDVKLGDSVPLGFAIGVHNDSTLDVDLRQHTHQNLLISLVVDASTATIYLPKQVGVRVRVDQRGGAVDIALPRQAGEEAVYANAAYGQSAVRFEISITTIGDSKVTVR